MIQVFANLFVGSAQDYENEVSNQEDWAVIHACKEPYHRRLLGYTTPAAPETDPEYLFAQRGDRLYLNLIDAPSIKYIPKQIIEAALKFIDTNFVKEKKIFIHCNHGKSRAPSIALMWMFDQGAFKSELSGQVVEEFTKIYPDYNPGQGMLDFVINYIEGR